MGFDAHDTHQTLDALAVHFQLDSHFAAAEERTFQIQLVQLAEQTQIFCALRPRLIVVTRTRHSQQFALLLNGQAGMRRIDPWTFVNR